MALDNKTGEKSTRIRDNMFYEGDNEVLNHAFTTTPLLELFSVSVNTILPGMNFDDCDCCEIYGTIKATNGLGHVFDLYNRKRDNPEFIQPNSAGYTRYLSLTGLKDGRVIIPYEYVTLEVCLRDRARNDVVIALGNLSFYYKETFYTKNGAKIVLGEAGFVTVHYAAFPYAVTACVDVVFFSKDDNYDMLLDSNKSTDDNVIGIDHADYDSSRYENDDDGVDFYGTVAAHASFPGSVSYGDNTTISSILLKLSHDECVQVKSRSFIELSRSMVAVPAYPNSPLQICVDLKCKDGSRLADEVLQFTSCELSQYKKDIVGENGRIRVRVSWGHAYEQRYRGSDLKRSLNEFPADPQPSTLLNDDWIPRTLTYRKKHSKLLEVFSVGVGSIDLKPPFKLYGSINVQGVPYYHLFKRDQSSPKICFDKIEVRFIADYGLVAATSFGIYVDLKDAEGNVFIEGFTSWDYRVLDKWYDKRICSLVRGDHGYVSLHYMIIYDAVQAHVKVLVKSNDTALNLLPPAKFYGSIVAQYSNHEYLTLYDEKYYQLVLFERRSDDPIYHLENDGSLPPSKNLVAVPRKSSLIIKADLRVDDSSASQLGVDVDVLQGNVGFNSDCQSSAEIRGKNYSVDILVTWSEIDYLC